MKKPAQTDARDLALLIRACLWLFLILLITALVSPAIAARDVKVANTELKPSLFTNDQGEAEGFFVDVIENIARQEGWNVIWISGSLTESWGRLATGEIDIMPGVTRTPEREKLYDFGNESALSVWSQVYARPDSGINTILDLEGKRVATVRGAQSGIGFLDLANRFDVNVTMIDMDTPIAVFSAVAAGEADALVVYNTAAHEDAKTYGLAATPVMFNPVQMTFAVQKGKNADLLAALDRGIAEGKRSPSSPYSQSMQKWFGIESGSTIPPWIFWGLGGIAFLAALFVVMSFVLRREVARKTAELSRQNVELNAAYEQLAATEESLRENFLELKKSEKALMQARKKLNLLNTLTFQDLQSGIFSMSGFIQIARQAGCSEKAEGGLARAEAILRSVTESMSFAKKYQDLGMNPPRWQNANYALLNALSHIDYAGITRKGGFDTLEIYADPLLEDVFLTIMETILQKRPEVTEVRLRHQQEKDGITLIIEDNGPGIPAQKKEQLFDRELMGTSGTSLFLAREILSITDISIRETGVVDEGTRFEITVPNGEYRFSTS